MLLVCGTIPQEDFPLTLGEAAFNGESLTLKGTDVPCTQGTAALVSAACVAANCLGTPPPHALLVGDRGTGKGSRALYEDLIRNLPSLSPDVLVLHYMLPVMGLMKKVSESADRCRRRPVMIADAAAMYAAKAAGIAARFDIFTPDLSETAFLADPEATHPAYVSRHLFESDASRAPELAGAAHRHQNSAKMLLIKGATDFIVSDGKIIQVVSEPDIPELEAIGGTGDTITGMLGAFIHTGWGLAESAAAAARINRLAGKCAGATAATKIRQVIAAIPAALKEGFAGGNLTAIAERSA